MKPNTAANLREPPAVKPEALEKPPAQLRMKKQPRQQKHKRGRAKQSIDERHRARL